MRRSLARFFTVAGLLLLAACDRPVWNAEKIGESVTLSYFEIPVSDMDRAIAFYSDVFEIDLERTIIDGYTMALFPETGDGRANGALAKGDVYVPGKSGPVIYFHTANIEDTLERAIAQGSRVLLEKQSVGAQGSVAEFEDSEGNRIALHQPLED